MSLDKSIRPQPVSDPKSGKYDQSAPRLDVDGDGWRDLDAFGSPPLSLPPTLSVDGFTNTSADIELQAAGHDSASIKISLGNTAHLATWAGGAVQGSVTSNAASQGQITISDGNLTGSYSATLSMDLTAILPDQHATIHLHILDNIQLSLKGTGYLGSSITLASSAGGTVVAAPLSSSAPSGTPHGSSTSDPGNFDLARFAASVLDTGQWQIAFAASEPGESLQGVGSSVMTIDATADFPGGTKNQQLHLHDIDRSNIAFNERSGSSGYPAFNPHDDGKASVGIIHHT